MSQIYTNHSLKATAATVLKEAGVTNKDICSVTGHKNPASLDSYVRVPNLKRRQEMSEILHLHKKVKPNLDVALPSPQASHSATQQELALPTSHSTLQPALAPAAPQLNAINANHTINTVHQDMPAMFYGVTFNGPLTININYNNVAK